MRVLKSSEVGYGTAAQAAAEILKAGGTVLYPTDTVYGLAVDACNTDALARLATLKGRDALKTPLIALPDTGSIARYARMNPGARDLADRFLPGPLTLVLPALPACPRGVVRKDGTVGVRVPNDPFCIALSNAFAGPYTSTSANLAGEPTKATIEEVVGQLGEAVQDIELAIDDGPREGNTPSTIVACIADVPELVREGAIPRTLLGL